MRNSNTRTIRQIQHAREQAATSQVEQERIHAERVASLEASWKVRLPELENMVRLEKPQHRTVQLELEDEYQNWLGELSKQQEAVQLRQKRELETLVEDRISAHAGVLAASEGGLDSDPKSNLQPLEFHWSSIGSPMELQPSAHSLSWFWWHGLLMSGCIGVPSIGFSSVDITELSWSPNPNIWSSIGAPMESPKLQ